MPLTVKKAKLTQNKWISLAIIAIKENHPLINTLIKMGMDLTIPVDKTFNLAFIDYIALYSFNEKLFKYLKQPRFTSSNVFGLTPAHSAAIAYTPAPILVKNKRRKAQEDKKPARTKKERDYIDLNQNGLMGSPTKFAHVFSMQYAFENDFLGFSPIQYVKLNGCYHEKNICYDVIEAELKRCIKILVEQLAPLLPVVLIIIIGEYLNLPIQKNNPDFKQEHSLFIDDEDTPRGLANRWISAFVEKTKALPPDALNDWLDQLRKFFPSGPGEHQQVFK